MLFNSYEFIFIFLPITLFIYFYLNSKKLVVPAKGFLVLSSLFFYSWWNVVYLPLILISILFNYVLGNTLSSNKKYKFTKKSILIFGIIANVSLLGYFKYSDFFILNINLLLDNQVELLNLALPLAISFFTFQQISYLVDSYNNETKEYDFLNYALFVSFFPQLIAGPIVHHKEMMPQFANTWNLVKNYKNIILGLLIFSIGIFKKVVLADNFSIWATNGFDIAQELTLIEAWITSLSYTFQLYFDFSGYVDMAIGASLMFNIKLPINFNSPYKSLDIQDFWRRWHITLSRFLRDYIYIPLGGSKNGKTNTYINLMATFLIGGFWHGAGWTFVFWGFLHGFALIINRLWKNIGFNLPVIIAWFITFNFVNITWIFFRAKEWTDAIKVLSSMFDFSNFGSFLSILEFGVVNKTEGLVILFLFVLSPCILLFFNNTNNIKIKNKYQILFCAFLLTISILSLNKVSEFLYFNF